MSKYSKKKANAICSLISRDSYTIAEICEKVRISESCFYNWQATIVEFGEMITRAREDFDKLLVSEAKKSLMKKIRGYTVQEKKIVTVDSGKKDANGKPIPKIKEQSIIDKTFQPDTPAIIFALTNKAGDEYQNKQNNEVTGKGGKDLFATMPDEELDKRINELERKLANDKG